MEDIKFCKIIITAMIAIIFYGFDKTSALTRTFYGEMSMVEYEPWDIMRVSLEFQFKTLESDTILLYAVSSNKINGKPYIINVSIRSNHLELGTKVARRFDRFSTTDVIVNDNQYHHVKVGLKDNRIYLVLDETHTITENDFDSSYMGNFLLYSGGAPKVYTDSKENSFIGCVTQFQFQESSQSTFYTPKVHQENGTGLGCEDRCLSQSTQQCLNKGRCLNRYVKTSCDCRGTGFQGETCQTPSQSLQFHGGHLIWKPHAKLNYYNTEIFVRFKSYQSSGIILFIKANQSKDGYILLELHKNALVLRSKSKDDIEEIITLGDNLINDVVWRYVRIFRNHQIISLVFDDGISIRSYTKEMHQIFDVGNDLTDIFIGGPQALTESRSQTSFKGCMQDIIISQVNLVEKEANNYGDIEYMSNVKEGCSPAFNSSYDTSFPSLPSIETSEYNSSFHNLSLQITLKKEETTPKYFSEESYKSKSSNFMWIVVGTCSLIIVLIFIVVLFIRNKYHKRQIERKEIRAHFLRETDDETLPITAASVNSRTKKRSCDLQTFSPVRKAFYVSSTDVDILRKENLV
ncbi:neurexin 1 isoform X1 [Hydra vulgaris]|uniref:neurexin 1 isoform X1 n=2 Tax=Hydra vulgaris TaxID=6087 RepID=UPI001F5E38D5|nr:neurexin-1a isoform X1 [Hydra vulgaris]